MGKPLNAKLIKELRKATGQRQVDLAELCGISEESVRLAERGRPVGLDVLTRLAAGLRVEPADQLLADRKLTLSEVRRLDDEGIAIEPRLAKGREARQAYQVTRARMNRADRRAIRYYLLSLVTPASGLTLEQGGINPHEGQIEQWNQAVYEGFLSACLFYLRNNTFAYKKGACGNVYTLLKSLMMGQHARKLVGSGEPDDSDYPRIAALEEYCDKLWAESEIGPGGGLSDDLHRYCQACEPGAFYRGWLECAYWLGGNVGLNLEHKREKSVDDYRRPVIDMAKSYLDEFEKKSSYGGYIFWAVTFYYLKRLVEGVAEEPDGVDFASSHEFTFEELLDHCGRCLEMDKKSQEGIKQVVLSYPDLATGYQIAILKLQTEFIYTGKPDRDLIVMAAARHPE